MKKAVIKQVTHGKNKGQFRFILYAANGEPIADSHPETYTQIHSAIDTITNNFPSFVIDDQTKGAKTKK